ncbi:MAG: Wzz/FepE/Etk N-terminal domain-containing protein [Solirubrobacteraceae bacterium]
MTDEYPTRAPGQFVRTLRDQIVLIVITTAIFVVAGYAYSTRQQEVYDADASLLVQDPATALTGTLSTTLTQAQLAAGESARVTRQAVAMRVKLGLHTSLTFGQLQSAVTTSIDPASNLVLVHASANTARLAADIADAFARYDASLSNADARTAIGSQASAIRSQLRSLTGSATAVIAARFALIQRLATVQSLAGAARPVQVQALASIPGSPSSPKTLRNTGVLGLLGLLVGIALADVRQARDRRLRNPQEIEDQLGLPLIGHISRYALGQGGQTSHGKEARELSAADLEGFRVLRQNLQFLDVDKGIRSIVVTSALAAEGKSTVAVLLAHANAAAGKLTLLIECDLRRPVFAERLGLSQAPGLSDYLAGTAEPNDILQTVRYNPMGISPGGSNGTSARHTTEQLVCIVAGSMPRPPELLATEKFREFLAEVSAAYDLVILDTGPLLPVVDTLELVPQVDGVLLCVRVEKTTREQAAAVIGALGRIPTRPTGLVLTGVTPRTDPYYTYYQSYTSQEPTGSAEPANQPGVRAN